MLHTILVHELQFTSEVGASSEVTFESTTFQLSKWKQHEGHQLITAHYVKIMNGWKLHGVVSTTINDRKYRIVANKGRNAQLSLSLDS